MRVIDIVKPASKDNSELHERWKNRLKSELATLPYTRKKKIKVIQL